MIQNFKTKYFISTPGNTYIYIFFIACLNSKTQGGLTLLADTQFCDYTHSWHQRGFRGKVNCPVLGIINFTI